MSNYRNVGTRNLVTPQSQPIPGSNQKKNNAGGFSYTLDDLDRFKRFLILGSSSSTYYVGKKKLTKDNLDTLEALLRAGRGKEVVDTIVEISQAGRAPKEDPALFALARCCACDVHGTVAHTVPAEMVYLLHRYTEDDTEHVNEKHEREFTRFPKVGLTVTSKDGSRTWTRLDENTIELKVKKSGKTVQLLHPEDLEVRQYAYSQLGKVVRIGTHWLHFQSYIEQFRGRGGAQRKSSRLWYEDMAVEKLAYQSVKYQSRDGWSQQDIVRLAHPHSSGERAEALKWIAKGEIESVVPSDHDPVAILRAFEQAKRANSEAEVVKLIEAYKLPREAVPTQYLKSKAVWEILLEQSQPEMMVKNLATMTRVGILTQTSSATALVNKRLHEQKRLVGARLHPIKILAAMLTYKAGRSLRSTATWTPVQSIVDALHDAFHLSFGVITPTNKRLVLAVDVSGSMTGGTLAEVIGLTPRVASTALALLTAATESNYAMMAFSHQFVPLPVSPKQRLDDALAAVDRMPFGGTDCSLPMIWAQKNNVEADAFIVLTDNETWAGEIHASEALRNYRQHSGINAKLIVMGMTATEFTIADPADPGSLDVVGFDTATPQIMNDFIVGNV